jgi:hypothetical protein
MKALLIVLLFAIAPVLGAAQREPGQLLDQVTSREFLHQLILDKVYFFIAPQTAESLLAHRVEPVMPLPHGEMMAHISGTVIIAFEITSEGIFPSTMT